MAKFCTNCGSAIEENQAKCNYCGKVLNEAAAQQATQETTQAYAQPQYSQPQQTAPVNGDAKSKMVAGLLGIFLGAFGVHNFYLGNTGKAVAQVLITVISCGILSGISGIWGLIEGILILTGNINTDGKGNPLVD